MKYLLDTHSFIWAVTDYEKLSKNAQEVVSDMNNDVFVSIISFWEMSIKYSIGKIDLGVYSVENFLAVAIKSEFSILQLEPIDAATGYQLPWKESHKDPFDRMLIWKALRNNYCIVSRDANFKLYTDLGLKLIW
ncbi:MAG: type II toxin-antitoxin system VapC family toxin [Cyclobacteriaceae bacterium]|nr:type II toxin-antitoxin system VapC family toxin [Cyclobacteriaceae bacterium]